MSKVLGIDKESGEAVGDQIVVIRKLPRNDKLPLIVDGASGRLYMEQNVTYRLEKEHCVYRRFTIGEAIRIGKLLNQSTKGPENFGKKKLHRQQHIADSSWSSSGNSQEPAGPPNEPSGFIPGQKPRNLEKDIYITVSIWEEFKYGSTILNRVSPNQISHGRCEWARPVLENMLPTFAVDFLLYVIFFALYFLSCCLYNDFLELGFYLQYDAHLRMHENADKCNVKLKFEGSAFQGPMHCFVRMCCQHCNHADTNKLITRLMKKMKQDIACLSGT